MGDKICENLIKDQFIGLRIQSYRGTKSASGFRPWGTESAVGRIRYYTGAYLRFVKCQRMILPSRETTSSKRLYSFTDFVKMKSRVSGKK